MDFSLIDLFLHLDQYIATAVTLYGPWIYLFLFAVIFCETGLVIFPFLPGDTLLFVAGAVAATGGMDPWLLSACLFSAAVLGDSTNYLIGRAAGHRLFANPDSKLFRREHLDRTHAFYERHGGKTVAMARFVPVVRTFAPFVAGMAQMPYLRFLGFSVLGTLAWVGILVPLGYLFGNVEFIKRNLSLIVLIGVGAAVLPVLLRVVQMRLAAGRAARASE
ncbi:DedA family protein [Chitinimonas koreensis]|uniref:DedA family protein n=1 Tax=Chitinimonas koreensis TaxID=356302 RepID=UPI00040CD3C6|nr:DedA family protein [Chitinimonas koreensis]QNM96099.1 DedA family protein [Chitinimonas koreensis]